MMKRIINLIIALLAISAVTFAQNQVDALRYSQNFYGGTARYMGMGGAFGALGGDFSCLSFNPAGIGIYRSSEMTITPTLYFGKTKAGYLGQTISDFKYNFNLNNFGIVISYTEDGDGYGWKGVNLGFGYNRLNNFHNNVLLEGVNNNSSMADYFLNNANGTNYDELSPFSTGLAWYTYVIDTFPGSTNQYSSAVSSYGQTQRKTIHTEGSIGEYVIALGANYSHKLYLGATIGIQDIYYEENSVYTETANTDTIGDFTSFDFQQHLQTAGTGFNFKIGMLYRPVNWARIGAAVHTPTFISLEDNYYNSMSSVIFDQNFDHESPKGIYNYDLTTPLRVMGSMAFIFKKYALLSVDYEFVDYTTARLRANDYSFILENEATQTMYTATGNIRAGLELRNGPFSVRGGYGFYGSPYTSSEANSNANYSTISGGFGIKDKGFFIDIAYVYSTMSENYYLYDHADIEPVTFDKSASRIMTTIGIKF